MKWKRIGAASLAAFMAVAAPGSAAAADEDKRAAQELDRARQEVERAREAMQRATRELARSMARLERDNPKAQYFAHMTDPDRPMLGIIIGDETDEQDERGLKVLAVTPGGGADKAGLKAGDVIVSANGKPLAGSGKAGPMRKLHEAMKGLKAGDKIDIEYERDGKKRSVALTTTRPDPDLSMAPWMLPQVLDRDFEFDFEELAPLMPKFHFRGPAVRGLQLAKLDDELAWYFKTKEGVLVVKTPKNDALDLRSGDVIQKIDGQAVSEPVTVLDLLHSHDRERAVTVEVLRRGKAVKLEGRLPVADAGPRIRDKRVKIIVTDDDDGT